MFGYKNDKYMEFGYFLVKLDDVFNYILVRIIGILIIILFFILRYDYVNSFKIYKWDRYNYISLNSVYLEVVMVGVLDL